MMISPGWTAYQLNRWLIDPSKNLHDIDGTRAANIADFGT
jgi:hypothetical protein